LDSDLPWLGSRAALGGKLQSKELEARATSPGPRESAVFCAIHRCPQLVTAPLTVGKPQASHFQF
jgi:hypothetical protein